MEFFATAAKGTEPALRDELRELRFKNVRCDRGGVHFGGEWEEGFRACLFSSIALRVLTPLSKFIARDAESLYEGARNIDWLPYLTPRQTLSISASCKGGKLTHSNFIALKTKDAVVDRLREKFGERPSVDRQDPDVHIFVHVVRDEATVYLDLAGESLHRRGYREGDAGEAPLKETLAAAVVRLSGWNRDIPLIDPMCGSGTIAIEAALWAMNIAPGILRKRFGFERWAMFDENLAKAMAELREEAKARIKTDCLEITASDIDRKLLEVAKQNASRAGVKVTFLERSVFDIKPEAADGHIITNPPYGKRLEVQMSLYQKIAEALMRLNGYSASLLEADRELPKAFSIKPVSWYMLFNGDIACRLLNYKIP